MYTNPTSYKARKDQEHDAEEAWHIAAMKDPQIVKRHYEKEEELEAEERLMHTDPLSYEHKQIEKQKAELKAL